MEKFIETIDILNKINEVTGEDKEKLNDIYLRVKDSETGNIQGVAYNYVADNILFLFTIDNLNHRPLAHYLMNLEGESYDRCWDSLVEIPEGYTHPDDIPDDAVDWLTLSEEDMAEGRYNVVTGLDTRVFFGDMSHCPIAKYEQTRAIKSIEVVEDAIVLVY